MACNLGSSDFPARFREGDVRVWLERFSDPFSRRQRASLARASESACRHAQSAYRECRRMRASGLSARSSVRSSQKRTLPSRKSPRGSLVTFLHARQRHRPSGCTPARAANPTSPSTTAGSMQPEGSPHDAAAALAARRSRSTRHASRQPAQVTCPAACNGCAPQWLRAANPHQPLGSPRARTHPLPRSWRRADAQHDAQTKIRLQPFRGRLTPCFGCNRMFCETVRPPHRSTPARPRGVPRAPAARSVAGPAPACPSLQHARPPHRSTPARLRGSQAPASWPAQLRG